MWAASLSLVMGLLLLAALFRLCSRLAANSDLPWGRAFGLAALVSLVYRGLWLAVAVFLGTGVMPPLSAFLAVALATLVTCALLAAWIVRDGQGQPVGLRKGALIAGLLFLFVGLLAALLYFTLPVPPS